MTGTVTKIQGPQRTLTRFIWLLFFVLATGVLLAGLSFVHQSLIICDGPGCSPFALSAADAANIKASGVSLEFLSALRSLAFDICALVFYAVAIIIFLRGIDTPVRAFAAFAFVGAGVSWPLTGWQPDTVAGLVGIYIVNIVAGVGFVAFTAVFPSGHSVPRWMKGYTLASIPAYALIFGLLRFGDMELEVFLIISLIMFIPPSFAQVYRYIRVSSPQERQQAKWALAGVGLVNVVSIAGILTANLLENNGALAEFLFFGPIGSLSLTLIPVGILVAIQKWNLWDINFIINRSLVYGVLTSILVGLMITISTVIGQITSTATTAQSALIALIVSGLLFGIMYQPLHKRLRMWVDSHLYGIELDYHQALNDYRKAGRQLAAEAAKSQFGTYSGLTRIGRGGMGEVYRAHDGNRGRMVALKVLPLDDDPDDEVARRFRREAQVVEKLNHPNIVKLYEIGIDDEAPYMVMEYIDGPDVSALLKENGSLPLDQTIAILTPIAAALDYAHSKEFVHRDIKPSNVMVDGDGRAVLMDFGIARITTAMTQLTGTGSMVGTLDYISPEQIQGAAEVDHRADIYSLGVMAYQMLTGELPFKKQNPGALVLAHLMEPPPDACAVTGELPDAVCDALRRAMAKKPEDRFALAGEFVAALGGF